MIRFINKIKRAYSLLQNRKGVITIKWLRVRSSTTPQLDTSIQLYWSLNNWHTCRYSGSETLINRYPPRSIICVMRPLILLTLNPVTNKTKLQFNRHHTSRCDVKINYSPVGSIMQHFLKFYFHKFLMVTYVYRMQGRRHATRRFRKPRRTSSRLAAYRCARDVRCAVTWLRSMRCIGAATPGKY